ncbi:MAG: hypothetical protein QOH21_785 [Acidobacteriota bacterium]|jgi:hypothetical protein|nr:hypothetical protein [Acidobacteriota bacterium]
MTDTQDVLKQLEEINASLSGLFAQRDPAPDPDMPLGGDTTNALFSRLLGVQQTGDAVVFRNALANAFRVDKNAKVTYTAPSAAIQTLHTGSIPLSGEPASMQVRVRTIVNEILPLLASLKPLTVTDLEDAETTRTLVGNELRDLVALFGGETLVPQRIDLVFRKLMQYDPEAVHLTFTDPDVVRGLLGKLRHRFALTQAKAHTLGEDQTRTDFRIIVNYVDMLKLSWHAMRGDIDRTGADSIGSVVQQMYRGLLTLRRAVRNLDTALSAEAIGQPERMAIELDTAPPITLAEAMAWCDDLASPRITALLREGREAIASSFLPAVQQLCSVMTTGLLPLVQRGDDPTAPAGLPEYDDEPAADDEERLAAPGPVPAFCEDPAPAPPPCDPVPFRIRTLRTRVAAERVGSEIASLYQLARRAASNGGPVIEKALFYTATATTPDDRLYALMPSTRANVQIHGRGFDDQVRVTFRRGKYELGGVSNLTRIPCGLSGTVDVPTWTDLQPGPIDLYIENVRTGGETRHPAVINFDDPDRSR